MKLLLVDANNLAFRMTFAYHLSTHLPIPENVHPDNIDQYTFPTGVLFGFFRSIVMLRKNYPEHYLAIIWDGGYTKRLELTKIAVANKIIPELYKQNRQKIAPTKEFEDLKRQKPELRTMLSLTNIPQIHVPGEEADDVAASYARQYDGIAEDIIIYTNDEDYYQLLSPKVRLLRNDPKIKSLIIVNSDLFTYLRGIQPSQWVDVCAFWGDDGDNIFGVPGWGEKTSLQNIKLYGSLDEVMVAFHKELDPLRIQFPDLTGDNLKELQELKSPKGIVKYPDVNERTPFTGVAMALEKGVIKKPKSMVTALMFEERARIAKTLKAMHDDLEVPVLPGWKNSTPWNRSKPEEFLRYCSKYQLNEIASVVDLICSPQPI